MMHHANRKPIQVGEACAPFSDTTLSVRRTELLIEIIELAVKHLQIGHVDGEQTRTKFFVRRSDDWVSWLNEDDRCQLLDAIEVVVLDRMAA
jgi:hypothetical protein